MFLWSIHTLLCQKAEYTHHTQLTEKNETYLQQWMYYAKLL